MRIDTADGATFRGADAREVVERMRASAWIEEVSSDAYMEAVAARVLMLSGGRVKVTSPIEFLVSLAELKLIEIYREEV